MPSNTYFEEALAQDTKEVYLVLLTITHPDLAQLGIDYPEIGISNGELRLVRNTVDITSRTKVFMAFGFEFTRPNEGSPARSVASIQMDNVDQRISLLLTELTTKPTVKVEIVLASNPDVVEQVLPNFKLSGVSWDADVIEGELSVENDSAEPVTAYEFNPKWSPAIF